MEFLAGRLNTTKKQAMAQIRTARSVWLEIKSDNVEETRRKILGGVGAQARR
jgi:hypothetical protein